MVKNILLLVFLFNSFLVANSQETINDYKYILIPNEFEFSKVKDEYNLNSLAKFLFNKNGFNAYLEYEKLPDDLRNARCLALTVDVLNDKSGLFKTKLEILLKDCDGKEIMRSDMGESCLKKYDRAYNEAFRKAFTSFENLGYVYKIKEEATKENTEIEIVTEKETKEDVEVEEINKEPNEIKTDIEGTEYKEVLYAQAIKEGFQLVNKKPEVVMVLLSTSGEHIYMVKDKSAIVYKEQGTWIYYESDGTTKFKKELVIKF